MLVDMNKRRYTCCFTGHRPEKLEYSEEVVKMTLEEEIKKAIDNGIYIFISGMARGFDIWAAEIVLKLRSDGYYINLICASPYEGFEKGWKEGWKKRYQNIIEKADIAYYISPEYSRSCFQKRNEWMVNRSGMVIAAYNGQSGGTKNTIKYAKKQCVPVTVLECSGL